MLTQLDFFQFSDIFFFILKILSFGTILYTNNVFQSSDSPLHSTFECLVESGSKSTAVNQLEAMPCHTFIEQSLIRLWTHKDANTSQEGNS